MHAHGHSRKQIAAMIGVAPETISVWKRHPQWQQELDRWRQVAGAPLQPIQLRLQLESLETTLGAFKQLELIMENATKRVRTSNGISEQPDWPTRLKACRLVIAATAAAIPELGGRPDRRTLRTKP